MGETSRIHYSELVHRVFRSAKAPSRPRRDGVARRLAILVVHGMGQQVRFETLDRTVQGLVKAAPWGVVGKEVRLGTVELAGIPVQRAELDLATADGKALEIHVYEGYWASLTQGLVTYRDVMRFLAAGALHGLRSVRSRFTRWRFTRWLFGRSVKLEVVKTSYLSLLLATCVAAGIALINLVIVATVGGGVLRAVTGGVGGSEHVWLSQGWPDPVLVTSFTVVIGALVALTLVLLGAIFALALSRASRGRRLWSWLASGVHLYFFGWSFAVPLIAGALPVMASAQVFWPRTFERFVGWTPAWFGQGWFQALIWLLLLGVSYYLRRVIVQNVGDVAAYLSSHKLDRFMHIRENIQRQVQAVAKAIYKACDASGEAFDYDGVTILGHSLGSVVAYDTLNRLINDDEIAGGELEVLARTQALVTFGSPLDKTAFIFRYHSQGTTDTREALASAVQPLIQDYQRYRSQLEWINVYSERDIISGPLDYYDDPEQAFPEHFVRNVEDPDARTPLAAHVEYWDNPMVFEQLSRVLLGDRPPAAE